MQFIRICLCVVLAALLGQGCQSTTPAICAADRDLSRFSYSEKQMGVDFNIVLYAADAAAADAAAAAAFARIAALNRVCSDYDADSELRQLGSADRVGQPQSISDTLFQLLSVSRQLGEETDGAFDVSVGPCVLLWRQARGQRMLPAADKLAIVRGRVGPSLWRLDPDARTVTMLEPGMRLDLGAIAKGYAADAALAVLRDAGMRRALVDGGGDIALGEPPPGQDAWRITILGGHRQRLVELNNCGIATSGDTEQYVEIGGKRYSHIIDPRTGVGMTNRALTTAIASSCMLADAAASAVTVLGAEKGLAWAATREVKIRFEPLDDTGNTTIHRSIGFPREQLPGLSAP